MAWSIPTKSLIALQTPAESHRLFHWDEIKTKGRSKEKEEERKEKEKEERSYFVIFVILT
jgi:hypothetical protein